MTKKEVEDLIFAKYDCLLLSRKQVAKILNKSVATIDRWKKRGVFLEYKKDESAKNGSVVYSVETVAEYILNNKTKVL